MTDTRPKTPRSPRLPRLTALALCGALAASGCAGAERAGSYTFTVRFDPVAGGKVCPVEASMEEGKRNCGLLVKKRDCVRAYREEQVFFRSEAPKGTQVPDWRLFFDPFQRAPIPVEEGAPYVIHAQAPHQPFYFYVAAEGCPVLDPQIIVED